VPDIDVFMCET